MRCRPVGGASLAVLLMATVACTSASGAGAEQPSAKSPPSFVLSGVTDVTQVAQLTGPDSTNRTDRYEVAGQDLGSMFRAYGKTWFVFGDTFGQHDPGQTGGGGTEWRSNTLAYTTDTNPVDGIRLDGYIVDEQGWAKELVGSKKVDGDEITTIPTYGFEANGALYLAYMSVKHWGDPGEWETNYSGFAKSTDRGHTWRKLDTPKWGGTSNFVQVSVAHYQGELYFWGVTHGRFGGVQLMKVRERDVENKGAYRYFTGTAKNGGPQWTADERAAKTIVDSTVGELSVAYNKYLDRWLMTYTDGAHASADIREGVTPWGPWGEAITLRSQEQVPGLYSPYMLPEYTTHGGRTIYFTLSKWGPYNVFWYRADLVRAH